MANEKRLTDVNALEEHIADCFGYPAVDILHEVATFPTVDAVEVVHGRWIGERCAHKPHRIKNPEKWLVFKCSVCGYSNGRKQNNYCPNCGAKMDLKGE